MTTAVIDRRPHVFNPMIGISLRKVSIVGLRERRCAVTTTRERPVYAVCYLTGPAAIPA